MDQYTKMPFEQHDLLIQLLRDSEQLTVEGRLCDLDHLLVIALEERERTMRDPARVKVPGEKTLSKRWGVSAYCARETLAIWRHRRGTEAGQVAAAAEAP